MPEADNDKVLSLFEGAGRAPKEKEEVKEPAVEKGAKDPVEKSPETKISAGEKVEGKDLEAIKAEAARDKAIEIVKEYEHEEAKKIKLETKMDKKEVDAAYDKIAKTAKDLMDILSSGGGAQKIKELQELWLKAKQSDPSLATTLERMMDVIDQAIKAPQKGAPPAPVAAQMPQQLAGMPGSQTQNGSAVPNPYAGEGGVVQRDNEESGFGSTFSLGAWKQPNTVVRNGKAFTTSGELVTTIDDDDTHAQIVKAEKAAAASSKGGPRTT